ncbi:MAG: hypothetical protein JXQ75_09450, partial [Phycisphaerae bacterium]|nr:hypothetical protein [Phycisphaerae bacterium]
DVVVCQTRLGDMDGDNAVDGDDVQGFVTCQIGGSAMTSECVCADMNGNHEWDTNDIEMFVDCLLGDCP